MRLSHPRPRVPYYAEPFKWHAAWTIDIPKKEARHASGLIYEFTAGRNTVLEPPLGAACPSGAWHGALRGGASALPCGRHENALKRLCLEACMLFSEEASFTCQDCLKDTGGDDYYMVTDEVWDAAHPSNAGMICLACLETRIGRGLHRLDFIDAPINHWNAKVQAICLATAETPTPETPEKL